MTSTNDPAGFREKSRSIAKGRQGDVPPHYRMDIQGLRAVAVLAVIIFHAGLFLPGGYLGVDMFFVISGYVVGGLLLRRTESLKSFWVARFMRLAPASIVLIVVTLLIFLAFFWADSYRSLPITALAGLFFGANVAIEVTTGDYFDAEATLNPLLHIWSLSVEEQIYFVLPLMVVGILWAIRKRATPGQVLVFLGLLALGSLALAFFGSSEYRGALGFGEAIFGFYSPVTRLWEFLAGFAAIFWRMFISMPAVSNPLGAVVSFVLIATGFFLAGSHSPSSVFLSVLVVVGTTLVIAFPSTLSRSLLESRTLVWIGDRSYSIYLWHWPPVVVAHVLFPESFWAPVVASCVSLVPAYFSHRYLEAPFRRLAQMKASEAKVKRQRVIAVFAGAVVLLVPAQYLGFQNADFRLLPGNNLSGDVNDDAWMSYASTVYDVCAHPVTRERGKTDGSMHYCLSTDETKPPEIAIVGDSHAAHFFVGLAEMFPESTVVFVGIRPEEYLDPESLNTYAEFLQSSGMSVTLIFSYRWEGYEVVPDFSPLARELESSGNLRLAAFTGLPTFPMDPAHCKNGYGIFSVNPDCAFEPNQRKKIQDEIIEELLSIQSSKDSRLVIVDTFSTVCSAKECSMDSAGTVLFADHHHLNLEGSRFIVRQLSQQIYQLVSER